jgi:threonylcarbamoyladenosine tRNA methylthiotransferase MtaB
MKRIAIATLGCKVNQFETADMAEQLKNAGWELVPFKSPADIYLINTCTVTSRSDAESRRLIRRARRLNPEARVIATGCYAQVQPEELSRVEELDQVLGNQEKNQILHWIDQQQNQVTDLSQKSALAPLKLTTFAEHTRAFLQVQTGCEQNCSYCIVPIARGPNRSVPEEEVLAAVARLADVGYREIVLTGIHLGAYGIDQSPAGSLTALVRQLVNQGRMPRIRLGSIEPNELTDELLDLISISPAICKHLHIPLQSGSSTVLKRMKRDYDAGFYRELVLRASRQIPDAFIAADVIAGFPGETELEFEETCQLVNELPLADLHIFPYSKRPGTVAATMSSQLQPAMISARAEKLRRIADQKRVQFQSRFTGQKASVLGFKHDPRHGLITGLTGNYLEVTYQGTAELINQESDVLINALENSVLNGRLV